MTTDFDLWLANQLADSGAFTLFVVPIRMDGDRLVPLKSSYVHLTDGAVTWRETTGRLDAAGAWDGAAFFVGLGEGGGPLPDLAAALTLAQVEAEVKRDPLVLNRGRFFDAEGGQVRIDEVAG
ncbi:hypothetical protein [Reyranella sp.]|uniref:hypothetical protein n=1 Tax=Reyranella sp. TaxID=1929291 RepID=UPI003BA84AEC